MNKSVQAKREMGIGRKAAAHAQRVPNFGVLAAAVNGGEADIVNLRIGAPDVAASNADFELARQIVEISVAHEEPVGLQRKRRCVADLIGIHASQGASSDVAGIVAASTLRGQARATQCVQ